MNPRNSRIVAAGLGTIVAVLGGILAATVLLPGGPAGSPVPAANAGNSGVALPSVIAGPGGPGSSFPGGSIAASAAPPSASTAPASAAAPPGAGSSPSSPSLPAEPGAEPTATITFVDLKLDSKRDPKGMTRAISFSTDGPGTIQAQFITHAPQGTAQMCLTSGTALRVCKEIANGTVVAKAISGHNKWTVTLRGSGVFTPIADVVLTFPAANPSVTIAHARMDGRILDKYNGITTRVSPRADGNLHLVASWPRNLVYEIGLVNETNGAGNVALRNQGPAMQTDQTLALAGSATWRLTLRSPAAGLRATELTATIGWP